MRLAACCFFFVARQSEEAKAGHVSYILIVHSLDEEDVLLTSMAWATRYTWRSRATRERIVIDSVVGTKTRIVTINGVF